jgi:hypothetical protein
MTNKKDVYGVKIDQNDGFDKTLEAYQNSKNIYESTRTVRTVESSDSIVNSIIDEHIKRAKMGKAKYNADLDRTDLSVIDYLQHAKEEAMDMALYLEKLIQMLNGKVEESNK